MIGAYDIPLLVRLGLLCLLGMGALWLRAWLGAVLAGGLAAAGLHWLVGWPWLVCLFFSWSATFAISVLLPLLQNYRFLFGMVLILGTPTFLLSKFLAGASGPQALADGLGLALLLPIATVRVLAGLGIIRPEKKSPSAPGKAQIELAMEPFKSGAPSGGASSPISTPPHRNPRF